MGADRGFVEPEACTLGKGERGPFKKKGSKVMNTALGMKVNI